MAFLIVGTGRCGTASVAKALTDVGIPCGHEDVFTNDSVLRTHEWKWGEFRGDVSWRAMPVLPLDDDGIFPVIHLLRHPLSVISSMATLKFHDDPGVREVVETACPAVYSHDDAVGRAAHHWMVWNARLSEVTHARLFLETLNVPDLLAYISPPARWMPEPLPVVHPWYTRSAGPYKRVTWDDLPQRLGTVVRAMAENYGYEVD